MKDLKKKGKQYFFMREAGKKTLFFFLMTYFINLYDYIQGCTEKKNLFNLQPIYDLFSQ